MARRAEISTPQSEAFFDLSESTGNPLASPFVRELLQDIKVAVVNLVKTPIFCPAESKQLDAAFAGQESRGGRSRLGVRPLVRQSSKRTEPPQGFRRPTDVSRAQATSIVLQRQASSATRGDTRGAPDCTICDREVGYALTCPEASYATPAPRVSAPPGRNACAKSGAKPQVSCASGERDRSL